ncbi:ABC-type bacteriocin/lantibiotic exporter, contains an N-terminal double-glycine peptidase domain [Clostridium collagenovorans DSM 3089]|uniref:ABC-type bacteriocin/lantibiotic exporter, contains an N-terminal double-glycine peptidase domain n=1 Tax=Clostridium collagenovorans DSM 3089 TaxID=1121306 RepID=A0A1M5V598_9CLOT|nr:ABC transporter ATP-binding protein [Clostridium collagenovorans]SHH70346.1 ABC-type bacteriocin/lantibiotic exporter, contains an N-terminal double-glycine peptidase domain [Clostridium collagenovorans DSM 3089]
MHKSFCKIYGLNSLINIGVGYIKSLVGLFVIYSISKIFNSATMGETHKILNEIPKFIIIVTLFTVFNFIMDLVINLKRQKNNKAFMSGVYERLLKMPYEEVEKRSFGEIITRLDKDMKEIIEILDIKISELSISVLTLITYVVVLFNISSYYSITVISLGLGTLIVPFILKKKFDKAISDYYVSWEALENSLITTVKAFDFIKLNNLYKYFEKKYFIVAKDIGRVSINLDKTVHMQDGLKVFVENLGNVIGFAIIGFLLYKDVIGFGQVIICVFLGKEVLRLLNDVFNEYSSIQKYKICKNRVYEILNSEEKEEGVTLKSIETIEFEDVIFSYEKENKVIQRVNFIINNGDKVLIEGENGAGKSTLLKLILNLYKDFSGSIKINDLNIEEINKESYKNRIRYVSQNQCFILENVMDNLMLFNDDIEVIKAYLEAFQLSFHEIKDKPYYELSGGQKQKVCIIRALIGEFDVLILDEPSNFLDYKSIEILKNIIKELDKTVIVISHDSSFKEVLEKRFLIQEGAVQMEDLKI